MDEDSIAYKAIRDVGAGKLAYCKFLPASETEDFCGAQREICIAEDSSLILFSRLRKKGLYEDKFVRITWQDAFKTNSRFVHSREGTHDKYQITDLGDDFPFLNDSHTGDLFIFVKNTDEDYSGFCLSTEEDIEDFLGFFGMSPVNTGRIIKPYSLRISH